MGHIASSLFFLLLLLSASVAIFLFVRQSWAEITAALKGEPPVRRVHRSWAPRPRPTVRPRQAAVAAAQRRAAF